jgi:SAM-dependent methyltransferase
MWLIVKFRFFDTRATNEDSVVTRQALGRAPRFRRWILEQFGPHLGQSVLEVNAGPGHTTSHLLDRRRLVITDSDPVHVETLRRRFGHLENIEVLRADFKSAEPGITGIDSVLLFDGLQRADEPKELLARIAEAVVPGGRILIQVPAGKALFGPTDVSAGHLRRFDREDVEDLIRASGLELISLEEFNRLGALGWRVHQAMGAVRISSAEARGFDVLVPIAKRFDAARIGRGLSWIAVARVP